MPLNRVFLANAITNEIMEAYAINGYVIQNELSSLDSRKPITTLMEVRRSNFMGQTLRVMTESSGGKMEWPKRDLSKVPFDATVEGYELDPSTLSGILIHVLDWASHRLNFTYKLFNRKDKIWGHVEVKHFALDFYLIQSFLCYK